MTSTPECHICLEELRTHLSVVPCGHVFHDECLRHALRVQNSCPICRRHAAPREVVGLFLEIPSPAAVVTSSNASSLAVNGATKSSDQTRMEVLKQRIQWYKQQTESLCDRFKQQQQQASQCLHENQQLLMRVKQMEKTQKNLQNQLTHCEFQLRAHAKEKEKLQVDSSIARFLESCQCHVLEEELRDPRELILALRKANKFRHEQYQRLVKEKAALKEALETANKCSHPAAKRKRHQEKELSLKDKRVRNTGCASNSKHVTGIESYRNHNGIIELPRPRHDELQDLDCEATHRLSGANTRHSPEFALQNRTSFSSSADPTVYGGFFVDFSRSSALNDPAQSSSSQGLSENESLSDDSERALRVRDSKPSPVAVRQQHPQVRRSDDPISFRAVAASTGSNGDVGPSHWNPRSTRFGLTLGANSNSNVTDRFSGTNALRSRSMQQLLQPYPSLNSLTTIVRRGEAEYSNTPLTRWLGRDS